MRASALVKMSHKSVELEKSGGGTLATVSHQRKAGHTGHAESEESRGHIGQRESEEWRRRTGQDAS